MLDDYVHNLMVNTIHKTYQITQINDFNGRLFQKKQEIYKN